MQELQTVGAAEKSGLLLEVIEPKGLQTGSRLSTVTALGRWWWDDGDGWDSFWDADGWDGDGWWGDCWDGDI